MELYEQLQKLSDDLNKSVKNLRVSGAEYAQAYTDYRIKVAKELINQRDQGQAVTIAGDIARGQKDVAQAKYNEILKEAIYKANLESINSIKLQIKIIENQIERDWGIAKRSE